MTGGGGGAVLRFSRDKRGYEHFYLIHQSNNRRGRSRSRLLYWFRTPPDVKVGRPPFDEDMRRTIEARYPDVTFDWKALSETPMPPPPEAEKWRERRRAERAAKRMAASEPLEDVDVAAGADAAPEAAPEPSLDPSPQASSGPGEEPEAVATTGEPAASAASAGATAGPRRRRRRRRGRRRSSESAVAGAAPDASSPETPELPDAADADTEGED